MKAFGVTALIVLSGALFAGLVDTKRVADNDKNRQRRSSAIERRLYTDEVGVILSENYPESYPEDLTTYYYFRVPYNGSYNIHFKTCWISLECGHDFLKFINVPPPWNNDPFCSYNTMATALDPIFYNITNANNTMCSEFYSDENFSLQGFWIGYCIEDNEGLSPRCTERADFNCSRQTPIPDESYDVINSSSISPSQYMDKYEWYKPVLPTTTTLCDGVNPNVEPTFGSFDLSDSAASPLILQLIRDYCSVRANITEALTKENFLSNTMMEALLSGKITYYGLPSENQTSAIP